MAAAEELTDIALCYQSMGLPIDASPAQIEQRYKTLTEEYKKKLVSAQPALRQEAKVSLDLLEEMYRKIQGSITYHATRKDHLKAEAEAKRTREVHHTVVLRNHLVHCPRCNGLISKGLKGCPICKAPLYTPLEKISQALTPMRLILCLVLFAVVCALAWAYFQPESFAGLADQWRR